MGSSMNKGVMAYFGAFPETTSVWLMGRRLKGRKNNEAKKVCCINLGKNLYHAKDTVGASWVHPLHPVLPPSEIAF